MPDDDTGPYDGEHRALMTWDLAGYRWDGRSATWGVGVRGALDDLGFRLGPKALVRLPLGQEGKSHVQLGITAYVFAGDGYLAARPGWSAELEVAPVELFSLALGREALQYEYYEYDWSRDEPLWIETSDVSWYAGAKFSQWTGVAIVAVMFGLAGAMVAD
jgi:hypothetical protein